MTSTVPTTTTTTAPTSDTDETVRFDIAGRFIDGISVRDFDAVVATLADDVTFRALLPTRVLDLHGTAAVRGAFDTWFGNAERWEMVEAVVGEVGGCVHLRWRVRLTKPNLGPGDFLVEQQVYAHAGPGGRLADVSLMCTGFRKAV